MIVRVPASSANLGPGFDALGMALGLHVDVGEVGVDDLIEGARIVDEHHPAAVAHRVAGGDGGVWATGVIPAGRGLGFSGAVRAAGAALGVMRRRGVDTLDPAQIGHDAVDEIRHEVFGVVAPLEGHPDNVAASIFGGVVAAAAGRVVRVPLAPIIGSAVVVCWVPTIVTKTDESRRALGRPVAFDDVVFGIGRVAVLVAALASGDTPALSAGTEDRLHQPVRLGAAPACAAAIEAVRAAGAWASWLSGSGPTVAALVEPSRVDAVVRALDSVGPDDLPEGASAHCKVLSIDTVGIRTP
jgi:homoserine kinase